MLVCELKTYIYSFKRTNKRKNTYVHPSFVLLLKTIKKQKKTEQFLINEYECYKLCVCYDVLLLLFIHLIFLLHIIIYDTCMYVFKQNFFDDPVALIILKLFLFLIHCEIKDSVINLIY